jgi:hypothetical protein
MVRPLTETMNTINSISQPNLSKNGKKITVNSMELSDNLASSLFQTLKILMTLISLA